MSAIAESVDDYLAGQPAGCVERLAEIRTQILAAAPDVVEAIRYGMPAYRLPNGHPVYFAGWTRHVSLHDIPTFDSDLEPDVAPYRSGKDTLKFPHSADFPSDLIRRVILAVASRNGAASLSTAAKSEPSDLPSIGGPATRALAAAGVVRLEQLTDRSPADLLALHGFGPRALRIITDALSAQGLSLRP